jgi:hypothetical protein
MSTATKTPARYSLARALKVAFDMNETYSMFSTYIQNDDPAESVVKLATELAVFEPETVEATIDDETSSTSHTPTVAILTALDTALVAIRATHPDVPSALAVVIEKSSGKTHGHFHAGQWADTDTDGAKLGKRHEISMSSESLSRGAEATLTTLIHEAGHALAHNTGVKDTSRQGRYHGAKFRTIAEGMGLVCATSDKIGTVTTGLNEWAKSHYAKELEILAEALTTHRVLKSDEKVTKPKTTIRVQCACEFPLTVPIKWWNDYGMDNLTCDMCADNGDDAHFSEV